MTRVASTVLVASSAALLATWIIAPASSAPVEPALSSPDEVADQMSEAVLAVNTEVDRLRERLASPVTLPAPSRDPFTFGNPPERRRPVETQPVAAVPVVTPPAPALPRLVAILSGQPGDAASWQAVFADGDTVTFVAAGDTIGRFHVTSVSADGVALVDRQSGASSFLSLQ